ncbi:GntR family transcriptional regulator [Streptomyces sp. NPDC059881]|uniref:GntR family transcriptional regulator n=1 Tax=Streptomyces sp. NPDC059881 TaxID=3346986 RepID=UPI00365EF53E
MQIADHFRQQIVDGALPQNTKLPPIAEIAEEWGVATATAAKGVKQLQGRGVCAVLDAGHVRGPRKETDERIGLPPTPAGDG